MSEFTEKYEVAQANFSTLAQRLARLNKRAAKLGVPGITMEVTGQEQRKRQKDNTFYTVLFVTVTGTRIQLEGGWFFVGVIEHTESGNILRPAPGQTLGPEYRTVERKCDWCQTIRDRKDTYIVESEAGERKQVGRSCLLDFTGHADPHKYARWAEMLAEFDEFVESLDDEGFTGRGSEGFGFWSYLEIVAMTIRLYGWTSKSKAYEDPSASATADIAVGFYYDIRDGKVRDKRGEQLRTRDGRPVQTEPEDMETAKAAVAWFDGLSEARVEKSDYLWNLWIAVNDAKVDDNGVMGVLPRRRLGIVASLIAAYRRDENKRREALAAAKVNGHEPQHVGEVKKRQEFTGLELTGIIELEGYYGIRYLHKFQDAEGNQLVWFKSTFPPLEEGKVYGGKATVKEHSEFNGVPQTGLTRAKFYPEGEDEFCPFCGRTDIVIEDERPGEWNRSCLVCCRPYTKEG